jgi:Ca2+-binding EF-hand superfamily protein
MTTALSPGATLGHRPMVGRRSQSRPGPTLLFLVFAPIAVALLAAQPVRGAVPTEKPGRTPLAVSSAPDDVQDLIYLAPRGPIIVRLHVHVDKKPLKEFRKSTAREIFKSLDSDKSGLLEKKELERIPTAAMLRAAFRGAGAQAVFSESRAAGASSDEADAFASKGKPVSPAELEAFIMRNVGSPFAMAVNTNANQQPVFLVNGLQQAGGLDVSPLLAEIDANHDGRLTAAEFAEIDGLLRMIDANDDEVVSRNEITMALASQSTVTAAANPLTGLTTLLKPIDRWASRTAMAHELIQLYDRTTRNRKTRRASRDKKLSPAELAISPADVGRFDKNGDGLLDVAETAQWLAGPTPQLELDVQLSFKSLDKPTVVARKAARPPGDSDMKVQAGKKEGLVLQIGSLPIEMQASESSGRFVFPRARYQQTFKNLDRNNNKYLEPDELRFSNLVPQQDFSAADRDGNGMLFEEEWLYFLELRDGLAERLIRLTVSSTSTDPITQFDANNDGRLSRKELTEALKTIQGWDVNHDERIAPDEIPRRFLGRFRVGREGNGPRPAARAMRMNAAAPSANKDAPTWFQKMDRNRDGEVSFREFLGPLAVFRRLDTDHDKSLSLQEAREKAPNDDRAGETAKDARNAKK